MNPNPHFIFFAGVIIYVFESFHFNADWYNYLFPVFLYPFAEIAQCSSIYMTVAIAVERFIGLCRPFRRLSSRPCPAKAYIRPGIIKKFLCYWQLIEIFEDPITLLFLDIVKSSLPAGQLCYFRSAWARVIFRVISVAAQSVAATSVCCHKRGAPRFPLFWGACISSR